MSQPSIDVAGKSSAFLLQPLACIIILALYGTQGALAHGGAGDQWTQT